MKILLLNAEFSTYEASCRASYACNFGLEDAFLALGIEVVTVPIFSIHEAQPVRWDSRMEEICAGHTFDQVWFEVCHSHFDEALIARFRELAPVRVGVIWEVLRIGSYEKATSPFHVRRKDQNFLSKVPLATHLIAVDACDVEDIENLLGIPTYWTSPAFVNRDCIKDEDPAPRINKALFYGTLYGHRKSWLEHPQLQPLLHRPDSPEWSTSVPRLYDQLIRSATAESAAKTFSVESFTSTVRQMKKLRRLGFELWLEGLQQGLAVVNLPQIGATAYAGRVVESMAAGRIAITCEIANRPRNRALFKEGLEIFHYPINSPGRLAEIIRLLQNDSDYRRETGLRAKQAIRERHTTEQFVAGVLKAIAGGERPPMPSGPVLEAASKETASGIRILAGLAPQGVRVGFPAEASPLQAPAIGGPLALAQRETLRPRSAFSSSDIASFLVLERNRWLADQATTILPGSGLVELMADEEAHFQLFDKCVCTARRIERIQVVAPGDGSADVVLCVEVLQRVPEPIETLREAARLLRPGGRLLLTASFAPSLGSPAFYYGGFAPDWYRHFCRKNHLCILEMRPNGGFFRWLGRQLPETTAMWTAHEARYGPHAPEVKELLAELLPAYLFELENRLCDHRLTTGYLVHAIKINTLEFADAFIAANPDFVEIYRVAADLAEEAGQFDRMRGYLKEILQREPDDREVKARLAY